MYGKNVVLWCYIFSLIVSSTMLWSSFTSDDRKKNYSTIRYQLDASITKNYDDEEDVIWMNNLQENSTKNSDIMPYAYRINFTSNDRENDRDLIKGENSSTYDLFRNFDRYNIVPDKICNNIACIRLCCPYDNYLVNRKCIAYEQGEFIVLNYIYGYINDSLQNKNEKIDELVLLIHDPCQKTGYYLVDHLLDPYDNALLVNGSLYLFYYNTIVESKFYCLADNNGQFAVNVCFDIMKEIMKKTKKHNKNTIDDIESVSLKKNWMYNEDNPNRNNKNSIVPSKVCEHITCIRLCCPFGNRLVNGKCIAGQGSFVLLKSIYGYVDDSLQNENKNVHYPFILIVHDPCQKTGHYKLQLSDISQNTLYINGSFYLSSYDITVESTSYCFADTAVDTEDVLEFAMNVCLDIADEFMYVDHLISKYKFFDENRSHINILFSGYLGFYLGLLLFSLMILIVYSVIPELRDIHGFILRRYSASIVIVNVNKMMALIFLKMYRLEKFVWITYNIVNYYFSLASWFWLSVMSIDMWLTFKQLCSLQRNVKKEGRKKLIMYSVYGWGSPFIFVIICGIMEFVVDVPEHFQPYLNEINYIDNTSRLLYDEGIPIILTISIICLCICTARKIAHHEKDIARHLRDLESRRYKNKKQWFNLYLKATKTLFIIFCMKSSINILSNIEETCVILNSIYILDGMQQFCIFVIFVWKRKIRQLLLKRFGC